MNTPSRVGLVLITGAAIALSASPAGAAPPAGSCPPAFQVRDLAQQIALIREIIPGISLEEAEQLALAALSQYDKNGDTLLCFREVGGPRNVNMYAFTDNTKQGSRR